MRTHKITNTRSLFLLICAVTLIVISFIGIGYVGIQLLTKPRYLSSYNFELYYPVCENLVRIERAQITEVRGTGVRTYYDGFTSDGKQFVFALPWAGVSELPPGIYVIGVGSYGKPFGDGPYNNCPIDAE